jgi:hypothetical protein
MRYGYPDRYPNYDGIESLNYKGVLREQSALLLDHITLINLFSSIFCKIYHAPTLSYHEKPLLILSSRERNRADSTISCIETIFNRETNFSNCEWKQYGTVGCRQFNLSDGGVDGQGSSVAAI